MSIELGGADPRILFADGTTQDTSPFDASGNPVDPRTVVNVTGSRALGATYVNDTGMEIIVRIRVNTTAVNGNLSINFVGNGIYGDFAMNPLNAAPIMVTLQVPPGESYTATGSNVVLSQWSEYRKVTP